MEHMTHWLGLLAGLIVGILVAAVLLRWMRGCRTLGFKKTEYDERQQAARGKAYRDGFWTMMAAVILCAALTEIMELSMLHSIALLTVCFLGLGVFVVSCIMRDAYIGLHDRMGRWLVVVMIATAVNFLFGLGPWVAGEHRIQWLNLLCGLLMVVILAALGIKTLLDRAVRDEEEE